MMVWDIENKMPPQEVVYWIAYFEIKERRQKQRDEEAKQGTKKVISKRHS